MVRELLTRLSHLTNYLEDLFGISVCKAIARAFFHFLQREGYQE